MPAHVRSEELVEDPPGGRSSTVWRVLAAVLAAGSMVVNGVVMLSDRAPGYFERLPSRLNTSDRPVARAVEEIPLPESDAAVHLVLWAVSMVLVGFAVGSSRRSLLLGAVGVLVLSAVIEVAQGRVTTSRNTEIGDLVANAAGIMAGLVAVAVLRYGWRRVIGRGART